MKVISRHALVYGITRDELYPKAVAAKVLALETLRTLKNRELKNRMGFYTRRLSLKDQDRMENCLEVNR